ncbi:MAG: TetR family transcriptional regulator [Kofleriaceae bacterium]
MTRPLRTNDELSAETISALTKRARKAFAQRGYAATSVEDVAAEAGLTKGAVYYHFKNKQGLFEAVLRAVQRDVVERIDARSGNARDPGRAVIAGCEAFLDVALDDEIRQIALVDGPSVVGWATWRAIDGEFGLGSLKSGLRECQAAGLLGRSDPDVLAHLISGALNEAVFLIAEASDRAAAHRRVEGAVRAMLRHLLGAD